MTRDVTDNAAETAETQLRLDGCLMRERGRVRYSKHRFAKEHPGACDLRLGMLQGLGRCKGLSGSGPTAFPRGDDSQDKEGPVVHERILLLFLVDIILVVN